MNSYKRNAFTYATIVAFGGFVFGLDAAVISGTVKFITEEFSLNPMQLGIVVGSPSIGVLLALFFAGSACDKFGRRQTLKIIAFLYVISAVGATFSPSYWSLVATRFLGGLAFSSISVASMYIGEIAPPKWRGKLVSMTQINIVLGLSAAYFVNYLILSYANSDAAWVNDLGLKQNVWRWMLGSEIVPAVAWLVALFFIPRSPAWLLYNGKTEEAKRTLSKIYPKEEVGVIYDEMQTSMSSETQDRSLVAQLKEIFSKKMRVILIIATTIAIAQQSTGINAILFYAPTVFEQLGGGSDAAFMQSIWVGLTSVVFTILGLVLVDRLGRRPLIIWGMAWIIISLGICFYGFQTARYTLTEKAITELSTIKNVERLTPIAGVEYGSDIAFKKALEDNLGEVDARNYESVLIQKAAAINSILILVGILSFIAAFHFSVGPVMWVLFSEIFPNSIRGIAIPFFTLITSVVSMLVQVFFPKQLATMGISYTLLFYAITVAIGLVILYRYLVETKNMTIEEIQLKLQSK
ncbi:sugar porter family MFS transporter [Flavobacterium sp. 7A]|uniref:sugar porter family MFS transporter n=1 Tax=Flavobacterium sp. 7A TaxID=2940571 RepID=UPI0022275BB5|nr:sugar porter family MFS transporter [Flavobacterium sp. 7A]MCW2119003.1 sugar porter (SP) family MFS transporter [Flavobacterium sp. 7A]